MSWICCFTELVAAGEETVAAGNLEGGSERLQSAIGLFRGAVSLTLPTLRPYDRN